jgi:methionine-rich copper-binding protein CopC
MSVNLHSGTGSVTCQLVSPDGHVMTLGSFWLDAGYGTWASPDPVSYAQFTSVRLVRTDGTVLATASLSQG